MNSLIRRLQRIIVANRRFLRLSCLALLIMAVVLGVVASTIRKQEPQQPAQQKPKSHFQEEDPFAAAAHEQRKLDPGVAPWNAKQPNAKLLIPRKIHHFFSTSTSIPVRLVKEINSWSSNHRDYDIYFWDAAHVERSLLMRPEFVTYANYYWNGTRSRVERDVIARLLILYQYGGISPDLNMRSLREVTDYLTDTSCVVAQDRVEKAVFSLGLEALPSLSIVACRPGHHFLTYFLRKITEVEFRTGAVVLDVATAHFVVHAYNAAVAAFDEECLAGRINCDFRERVSLAEPTVFMPVMEAGLYESLVANCKSRSKMPFLRKEACYNLDANGNRPSSSSLVMPIYVEAWAPNKDRPALPLVKIGPSNGGRKPIKQWSLGGSGYIVD